MAILWLLPGKPSFLSITGTGSSSFGKTISVYKNQIAVGDVNWTTGGSTLGAAFVYQLNPSTASYSLIFTGSGTSTTGLYAASLSLWENTLAVGAPGENSAAGNAYVYRHEGSWYSFDNSGSVTLAPTALLSAGDAFGSAVAICDNVVAISTPGAGNTGSIWLFQSTPSNFAQFSQIAYSSGFITAKPGDTSGVTLGVTGRYVFIGDPLFGGTPSVANTYKGPAAPGVY